MKKNLKSHLLFFTAIFFPGIILAQVQNIGKIISYKKIPGGVSGQTATANFDVHVYNQNTIRIRVTRNKSFNNFSYALADNNFPSFEEVSFIETKSTIIIGTNTITAEIQKLPHFKITFKNKSNAVINEDDDGKFSGTVFKGEEFNIYKKIQPDEKFIGMGEALGNLNRRGTAVTLNNTDTYKYGDARLPMYSSIPFFMGVHANGNYGIFLNNSFPSVFNFGISSANVSSITSAGGDIDYFFMYDSCVSKIIEQYTALTGRMPLPPKWSLGYHQSRCSYYPQEKIEWIAQTFRHKKIPLDCIVLDADYQQNYQPFLVNKKRFPNMPALAASLAKMNIELTASVYPGVKIDSNYFSYIDGLQKNVFLKYADGKNFETEIAPLKVVLPDYTNPKTRNWWIEKMKWLPDNGIHGYWNDMNEPAVGGSFLPANLLFDFDGRNANTAEAKNVYGMQMARSSFESAIKYGGDRRPFILTRSGFAGVQRYSAMWSGDNTASDKGLLTSVLLNNQLGLSGMPFCGHDIGGFIGDGNKDLYKRWIEAGVFSPFCRNHKGCGGVAGEPWAYDDEAEAISKTYIGLRYRLMPYIYSKFYEASQTGIPIARSLAIDFTKDEKVYDQAFQYEFLFGDAMLIAPVTSAEKSKKLHLPKADWYNMYTDEKLTGDQQINMEAPIYTLPVFIKSSSIIPMQSLVQSTKDKPSDTLVLHIYNGREKNIFTYYEDADDGMDYKNGNFYKREIVFDPALKSITFHAKQGNFTSMFTEIKIVLHGFNETGNKFFVNGKMVNITTASIKILDPLSGLEEYYDSSYFKMLRMQETMGQQQLFNLNNTSATITIKWSF